MTDRDDDPREYTLDELLDAGRLQGDTGSSHRLRDSKRAARANPFREAPTLPSARVSADTLVNQPALEVGEPSNEPEAQLLRDVLARHRADLPKVAAEMGIRVRDIYQQAKKHGIRIADYS